MSDLSDNIADAMDRLTALVDRFTLTVAAASPQEANLAVRLDGAGAACAIVFLPWGLGFAPVPGCAAFTALVAFGGGANPLLASLPDRVEVTVEADSDLGSLVQVMEHEMAAQRCGATTVLNRLGEVLFVRLLRLLIERGASETGVLGGLADARISRALVAIHDRPARAWTPDLLAEEAGLSRSRFADLFRARVGQGPAAYLRHYRLTLARQDLAKGDRVDAIARRYGFGSADAFGRAFRRAYGSAPASLRA